MSAPTREKILKAATELGYRPNPMARALRTGRTDLLAFWYMSKLTPHNVEVANHIGKQVWESPYNLILTDVTRYMMKWAEDTNDFAPAHWPVDGIFAFELGAIPDWILEQQGTHAPPIVYLGFDFWGSVPTNRIDAVVVNFERATHEAVQHLLETRNRVAMLCLEPMVKNREMRTVVYETLTRAAGREPEFIFPANLPAIREHAYQALHDHLTKHGCPDAIFCPNEEQAISVHLALSELGYRVPEDVALVGCDGLPEARYHVPPISTIVQPFGQMAHIGWEFLQKRLVEPDAPRQYRRLEAEFVARESSTPNNST